MKGPFRIRCACLAGLLWILAPMFKSLAGEAWTDPRLAVTNGVEFWYDAGRQNAARYARGNAALRSWVDGVDYLFDGSGHRRDLVQPSDGQRPRFRQEFTGAMVSFDGQDDSLFYSGANLSLSNLTVFAVAAPASIGGFKGILAGSALGQNDYVSGFNLDWGPNPAPNLAEVNAEGAGFSGEINLLNSPIPLKEWHVFGLEVAEGPGGVRFYLDGREQMNRDKRAAAIRIDDFVLGARKYVNADARPYVQGFYQGDWAETLIYNRRLDAAERKSVESYLQRKYMALIGTAARDGGFTLTPVTNPPPVHVMLPGFAARRLPLDLNNINNLAYRPDGVLVACGYDGRVWLLRDTDGDGLEDKAELFWDSQGNIRSPIGMALTPPGYSRGQGVFLAAKDKVVLLVDTNRDDRADAEMVVATWTERSEQQGVDALGVAVAPDESIYFSLGTASFTDGYVTDRATGLSKYLNFKERGTIQRVSADFSKRETVCRGIRFAVGMAFNRNGDLFCTDQEGATWLPNGNPFDELLHIQPGLHYGFPPRHPRLLPNVIDEPSVFDYAPQHQSTCGLHFNESAAGGPVFGSPLWAGDAIISGYSRGKIWRTQLVKTDTGYVGDTQLLATLQELTVEACSSPRGDLIVSTHSGKPDWGTGPGGKGSLWSIHRQNTNAALPLRAWSVSPTELKIAYDRPIDISTATNLAAFARLEAGEFVFPGDRYEGLWPGYQVVHFQRSQPRFLIPIQTASISADRRIVSLKTSERSQAWRYALTLGNGSDSPTDLTADLHGLQANWRPQSGNAMAAWLPHLDSGVAQALTHGCSEQEAFFGGMSQAGKLSLEGQLDLYEMLQPAIQPGSSLDYERPPEVVTVRFGAAMPFHVASGESLSSSDASVAGANGWNTVDVLFTNRPARWLPFRMDIDSSGGSIKTSIAWRTSDDPGRWRAFPVRRFLMSWVQPVGGSLAASAGLRDMSEIAGGNWLHGRRLFFGDQLACSRCHTIRGEGGRVGPDLSNLVQRDYASVRKDIEFPNAALNPDHLASVLELKDGESLTAIVLSEANGEMTVVDGSGARKSLRRTDVVSVRPAQLSLMPEGLWAAMTAQQQKDLMTFLLTEPLTPVSVAASLQGCAAPPPRPKSAFAKLLPDPSKAPASPGKPLQIILCASPKDGAHKSPGFHDYPLWQDRWTKLLGLADGVTIDAATRWPSQEQWDRADIVIFYHDDPAWDKTRAPDLDKFLKRGGGLVFLHWSLNAYHDNADLADRIGHSWGPGAAFRQGIEDIHFIPNEITAGLPDSTFTDEPYWNLPGAAPDIQVLADTVEAGASRPQVWTRQVGSGRVLVCLVGHFTWTFDDPLYRVLVLRGIAWAGGQPVDRLTDLATVGARFGE